MPDAEDKAMLAAALLAELGIPYKFRITQDARGLQSVHVHPERISNMLTKEDIQYLLERIGRKIVVAPSQSFPFEVTARGGGYSDDPKISALQAKLSIMLEAASRREA